VAEADLVLGYDFGTSAVKAALFARDGTIVATAQAAYPLLLPQPGWAEQAPDDWWAAMQTATRQLLAAAAPARVDGIGISAQMGGVIPVDASGRALANALVWLDTRSAPEARALMGGPLLGYSPLRLARWLRLTGGAPSLSGKDAISKIAWLRRHRPELWPKLHKLLDVKDYLLHRCTGRFVTTFDSAHLTWLFDARRKNWSPALLRTLGLDRALLPDIAGATEIVGRLGAEAAGALGLREGTPVAGGAGDVCAAALGAGNWSDGSLHLYLGTSAWLAARLPRSRLDPLTSIGSLRFAGGEGYILIATQENAGAALRWGQGLLGLAPGDFAGLEAAASRVQPHQMLPMFFPWLAGERVPVDDERIRGGFANLSLDSGREEIAFALYEGVALNLRWAMASFDRLSGRAGQRLRLVGGGGRSVFWAQMMANVLDREVELAQMPDHCGSLGAAMTAAVAAGWYPGLAAASVMSRPGALLRPEARAVALHAERHRLYSGYYSRLRRWQHRFHGR
jgi:xylulokinase